MTCSKIRTPMPTPKRPSASLQGIARLRAKTCVLLLVLAPSFSLSADEDAALIAQPKVTADTQGAVAPKSSSRQPAISASVANPAYNQVGVAPRLSEEAQGFNTGCLDAEGRASGATDCDLVPTHPDGVPAHAEQPHTQAEWIALVGPIASERSAFAPSA
jgi:hypothetical protein